MSKTSNELLKSLNQLNLSVCNYRLKSAEHDISIQRIFIFVWANEASEDSYFKITRVCYELFLSHLNLYSWCSASWYMRGHKSDNFSNDTHLYCLESFYQPSWTYLIHLSLYGIYEMKLDKNLEFLSRCDRL